MLGDFFVGFSAAARSKFSAWMRLMSDDELTRLYARRTPMPNTEPTLKEIADAIQPVEGRWIEKARQKTAGLVMPPRALGRLHDFAERMCAVQRTLQPVIDRKVIVIMAGDHGVVAEGVSAYPQDVTAEMIKTFLKGGAGINILADQAGADIVVVDAGIRTDIQTTAASHTGLRRRKVAPGTANMARGPAMSARQAEQALQVGFQTAADLIGDGFQILVTGDMGIGNTTASAAIGSVLTAADLDVMVGRGTGVDDRGLDRKKEVIRRALALNSPDPADGLDVLAKVGGFEIGGIAGCILAGAYYRCPVVIDGLIATAGALIAHALAPAVCGYLFAGHCSEEPGHRVMLAHLGLEPMLDLGMRLGEGSGAALALPLLQAAVRIFNEMLTFEEAGVSGKDG
jgi:nicotinate-nucleotide--dimethylbenzimidazole phosphoribosyltransferase